MRDASCNTFTKVWLCYHDPARLPSPFPLLVMNIKMCSLKEAAFQYVLLLLYVKAKLRSLLLPSYDFSLGQTSLIVSSSCCWSSYYLMHNIQHMVMCHKNFIVLTNLKQWGNLFQNDVLAFKKNTFYRTIKRNAMSCFEAFSSCLPYVL